jgi:hypothetical protein
VRQRAGEFMAKLRVRIVLNKGGEGAPLDQLADVVREIERFLRYLSEDIGLNVPKGRWLARNFENNSVEFDTEDPSEYQADQIGAFNRGFLYCAEFDPAKSSQLNGVVGHRTLTQFASVADALQPHEKIGFGIYRPDGSKPYVWRPLSKRHALSLREALSQTVVYVGALRGHLHNITVEPTLSFQLRLSRTNDLVRCDAHSDLYGTVYDAIKDPDRLLYVRGRITARRIDRGVTAVRATDVKPAPLLTNERYEAFFGSAPNLTGDLAAEAFVDEARSSDE